MKRNFRITLLVALLATGGFASTATDSRAAEMSTPAPTVPLAVEIQLPVLSAAYREAVPAVRGLAQAEAIAQLEESLSRITAPYERYQLILFELSFRYAARADWPGLFTLFQRAQSEGLFFPLQPGPQARPGYVAELAKLDGFDALLRENNRLRAEAEKTAQLEYAVEKPAGYNPARKYPLVIVLHGGAGCSAAMAERWQSPRLRSDCLVAFMQGSLLRGSFSRAFADDGFASLVSAYGQILERNSVDTDRVVLAGQSNGGRASIQLVAGNRIPARGLILAFPTKPGDLAEPSLRNAAARGVRAAFFCGEQDDGFAGQQEMRTLFERAAVPTLFRSFPDMGHELPDHFPERIDEALAFLLEPSR
ncbi:alpha/beta hydrolase [Opitutus terrae]|uniref:Dienelactone hydrolase domain-containing protein n=1 Tax=Opitutus terrae (strain DSM 11246 / JCM 15787 / PB90-1) TaxID=452637 RepID=B1ZWZ4_OPITP|nr:alpha/beta hydrolase [Opitutus terrae]ACB75105.1 hypothetical protein Oter_1822 [Opitutus terrae PB90-1]